jgi:hypothetical protein
MATVTPNFNWPVPTSTDLVRDGATAIEALGDSIDASLVDLKGGTTGQVLSKTSGTDMDFTWVTSDDANAIQNSIVDAKGDLISATANDTPARLAVGANGETLVADSSTSTGLRYTANFAAGKNKIINGDFGIWQRGTSFSASGYTADRFYFGRGSTTTVSRQTFTAGTAPVSGYEGTFFARIQRTAGSSGDSFAQPIEDVRTFAGQIVTVSFWAKAAAAVTLGQVYLEQNFGSGGSGSVVAGSSGGLAITTSWQRFTFNVTVPSISGKTIGTSSYLQTIFDLTGGMGTSFTLDLWGVQIEAGSVATAFQTATGTLQGETSACQRYYYRNTVGSTGGAVTGYAFLATTTRADASMQFPVPFRVTPTSVDFSGLRIRNSSGVTSNVSAVAVNACSGIGGTVSFTVGATTLGTVGYIETDSGTSYLGFSAEL